MTASGKILLFSFFICLHHGFSVKVREFPKDFVFGASSAAYQIEGGWAADGKGISIWDVTSNMKPSPIKDSSTGEVAANSYHQYNRDVGLMKDLGLDFYRFSISWTRILPDGFAANINQAGIGYYNRLISSMLENNIKPVVTMYHWDLPHSLQKLGGWTNPFVVEWFTDYSRVLFESFGDRVKQWVTINGPKQICYEGYGSAEKAPQVNITGIAEYMCAKNVLLAHAQAYHLYDKNFRKNQNGIIGISISCTWFEPISKSMNDYQAALDAMQFDWGQYANPIFSKDGGFPQEVKKNILVRSAEQGYPRSRLPELSIAEVALIRGSSDYFGINSYTTKLVYRDSFLQGMYPVPSYIDDIGSVFVKNHSWAQAQSAWLQEVPWGFHNVLMEVKKLYGNPPVYIMENGWSTAGGLQDDDRVRFYKNYLSALLDAIEKGADVRGYSAWSLIDNFEWMQGYREKFGLYEINYASPQYIATPRKSSFLYKEIIRSRKLDLDFEPDDVVVEKITEASEDEEDKIELH